MGTADVPAATKVIGIACKDNGGGYGIVGSTDDGVVTDDTWVCSSKYVEGWNKPGFQDTNNDFSSPSTGSQYTDEPPVGIAAEAKSLWGPVKNGWAFCKKMISGWQKYPGGLTQVAAGPYGVWGVDQDDNIFKKTINSWQKVDGQLKDISVEKNSVWGVTREDQILMRKEGEGWQQIHGSLKQISVSGLSDAVVWGVNFEDEIYVWKGGNSWQQISVQSTPSRGLTGFTPYVSTKKPSTGTPGFMPFLLTPTTPTSGRRHVNRGLFNSLKRAFV